MKEFETAKLIVKKSRNGLGIFAKKDFLAKEKLFEVKGVFLSCEEDDETDEETRSNTYRFDAEKFLSPKGNIGNYLNHSCNPNTRVTKIKSKLYVVALRKILKDEEATMDYSGIIAPDDIWEMKCNCGEKNCRGVIKRYNLLPKKLKESYIKDKIIPYYILRIK